MTLEEPFVPAEAGAGAPSHSHAIPGHPAGHSGEGALQPVMGLGQPDSLMLNREASCTLLRLGEGLRPPPSCRPWSVSGQEGTDWGTDWSWLLCPEVA